MTIQYTLIDNTLTVDTDTPEGTRLVRLLGFDTNNTVNGNVVTLGTEYTEYDIEILVEEATVDILQMNHKNYVETMEDFKKYKRVPKGWSKTYHAGEMPTKSTDENGEPLHYVDLNRPYVYIKAPHLDGELMLEINMKPQDDLNNYQPVAIVDDEWYLDIYTTVANWSEMIEYIKNMTNEDME